MLQNEEIKATTALGRFAMNKLASVVKMGGKLVSKQHGDARVKVCVQCPYYGPVMPKVGIMTKGCTICKCPSITKPYMDIYFSLTKLGFKKAQCSDHSFDRWADTDNQFFNLN